MKTYRELVIEDVAERCGATPAEVAETWDWSGHPTRDEFDSDEDPTTFVRHDVAEHYEGKTDPPVRGLAV